MGWLLIHSAVGIIMPPWLTGGILTCRPYARPPSVGVAALTTIQWGPAIILSGADLPNLPPYLSRDDVIPTLLFMETLKRYLWNHDSSCVIVVHAVRRKLTINIVDVTSRYFIFCFYEPCELSRTDTTHWVTEGRGVSVMPPLFPINILFRFFGVQDALVDGRVWVLK